MKIIIAFLFSIVISAACISQTLELEDANLIFKTNSPLNVGTISLTSGDIQINAPGSPGGIFEVQDEGTFLFSNVTNGEDIELEITSDGRLKFNDGSGGTNLMTLDDLGILGIGTANPSTSTVLHLITSANKGIRIESQPHVWDVYVDVVGDWTWNDFGGGGAFIDASNSFAYTTFSDRRLKRNISSVSPILDKVLKLNPSTYHLGRMDDAGKKSIGFIAQEVEKIFPDLVSEKDGYKSLAYSDFSVLAIKAIQEQQIIINQLLNRIEKLENRK